MWHIYLDESGDLGFDFVNKKPSKFFVVTILAISSKNSNRRIINAVKKTLKRKLNPKSKRSRIVEELKGTGTTLSIKKYFFSQIREVKYGIYSITLNKKKIYKKLTTEKDRVYNYIARKVLDQIPFEQAEGSVQLIVDKSKGKAEVEDFDMYIRTQLGARLNPNTPINIEHFDSKDNHGLQACDLFAWGMFQKHERNNLDWYQVFKEKVISDEMFL